MAQDIANTIQKYQQLAKDISFQEEKRLKSPTSVEVIFKNLPTNKDLIYQRYVIDSTNSNSYNKRKAIDSAINNARAMSQSGQAAIDYLRKKGFSSREIQKIQNALKEGKKQELMRSLSSEQKTSIADAITINRNFFIKQIDKINERPEIRLKKVEDNIIKRTTNYNKVIIIEPYSVNLILLKLK